MCEYYVQIPEGARARSRENCINWTSIWI